MLLLMMTPRVMMAMLIKLMVNTYYVRTYVMVVWRPSVRGDDYILMVEHGVYNNVCSI